MRLSRVVLPAPRYPVSTVTGVLSAIARSIWPRNIGMLLANTKPVSAVVRQAGDSRPQGRAQRVDVVPHQRDIGRGIAVAIGQRVRVELAADPGAGLLGNPLHETGID